MLIQEKTLYNSKIDKNSIEFLRSIGLDADDSGNLEVEISGKDYKLNLLFESLSVSNSTISGKISLIFEDTCLVSKIFSVLKEEFLTEVFYPFVKQSITVYESVINVVDTSRDILNVNDLLYFMSVNLFNKNIDFSRIFYTVALAILSKIYFVLKYNK